MQGNVFILSERKMFAFPNGSLLPTNLPEIILLEPFIWVTIWVPEGCTENIAMLF